jgi:2-methylisocitrate lyase-like PEP mutase family enzyme
MDKQTQITRAQIFHKLHDRANLLLLPNAWDAGSAALFAHHGFAAIATTSGGMAWSLGYQDGQQAPLTEVLAATARITRVVDLPVTVDMESGYGESPDAVAAAVRGVIDAGAVGINLEDSLPGHGPLRDIEVAAERIRAARTAAVDAGVPIMINARVDVWMQPEMHDPASGLDEAIRRAQAYLAAGADGIFPIGLVERDVLATLVRLIGAPINVAAISGMPDLQELARIGVARVSTATRFATLALGAVDHAVTRFLQDRDTGHLASGFGYSDAQRLFDRT